MTNDELRAERVEEIRRAIPPDELPDRLFEAELERDKLRVQLMESELRARLEPSGRLHETELARDRLQAMVDEIEPDNVKYHDENVKLRAEVKRLKNLVRYINFKPIQLELEYLQRDCANCKDGLPIRADPDELCSEVDMVFQGHCFYVTQHATIECLHFETRGNHDDYGNLEDGYVTLTYITPEGNEVTMDNVYYIHNNDTNRDILWGIGPKVGS